MRRKLVSHSGISRLRVSVALSFFLASTLLATFSFAPSQPAPRAGLRLATLGVDLAQAQQSAQLQPSKHGTPTPTPIPTPPTNALTFGHPVISGIAGRGFEQDIRLDPTNPDRFYTSVPGAASADTSWIWQTLDGGKTFKWVVGATALVGKVTTCHGGGDTELAVDSAGHLYFNDLTLANFSTSRSDDFGATFTCSNTGVPDTVVDRQWYAVDGDPTNGGTIYLTNDEVGPGGVNCPGTLPGNNVLVMYRSPVAGALGATAGITFGPPYRITAVGSCDEGIMGNDEISPIATRTGQPTGLGGFATLRSPVKHIFVIHDNTSLNQVRIGRCFPVTVGLPIANKSDPSGLNCTDILVSDLGPNAKTGGSFPTMAIDKSGNLYAVWEQAPIDASGNITGDTVLMYSYSVDEGNHWSSPVTIDTSGSPVGTLHNNVFAWIAAGDDGRVDIAWYGTTGLSNPNDPTCGQTALVPPAPPSKNVNGPDSTTGAFWFLWMVQSLNAHATTPTFTAPILASEHHVHRGTIQTLMGGQCGDRTLGDFLQLRMGALGEAEISYADSNNIVESLSPHGMFVRQNGGRGLLASSSLLNIVGLAPFNGVSDPTGDGKYEVNGTSSANMPQLDIVGSNISQVTTAPCSAAAPCYKVVMQLNNLSLAPTTAQDPDIDLVWLTQWLVPSTTDVNGGKNFHVYAESTNGGALQCFTGENGVEPLGGGVITTYPGGTTALPAANCQSTLGPGGNITIYVPLSSVNEPGAIDNLLHEVTASTMTLPGPANMPPSFGGIGGSLFNLIDVAQSYVFNPNPIQLSSANSRKVHGGAGTFDINLPADGSGVECRSGGSSGDYTLVFSFANPLASVGAVAVTTGTGSVSSSSINEVDYVVNVTGVTNVQKITVTLSNVIDRAGNNSPAIAGSMNVLIGDVTGDKAVTNADVSSVKQQVGAAVMASNFRNDVTANGFISNSDVSATKAQVGTSLP
jgi:hypothetical protein